MGLVKKKGMDLERQRPFPADKGEDGHQESARSKRTIYYLSKRKKAYNKVLGS